MDKRTFVLFHTLGTLGFILCQNFSPNIWTVDPEPTKSVNMSGMTFFHAMNKDSSISGIQGEKNSGSSSLFNSIYQFQSDTNSKPTDVSRDTFASGQQPQQPLELSNNEETTPSPSAMLPMFPVRNNVGNQPVSRDASTNMFNGMTDNTGTLNSFTLPTQEPAGNQNSPLSFMFSGTGTGSEIEPSVDLNTLGIQDPIQANSEGTTNLETKSTSTPLIQNNGLNLQPPSAKPTMSISGKFKDHSKTPMFMVKTKFVEKSNSRKPGFNIKSGFVDTSNTQSVSTTANTPIKNTEQTLPIAELPNISLDRFRTVNNPDVNQDNFAVGSDLNFNDLVANTPENVGQYTTTTDPVSITDILTTPFVPMVTDTLATTTDSSIPRSTSLQIESLYPEAPFPINNPTNTNNNRFLDKTNTDADRSKISDTEATNPRSNGVNNVPSMSNNMGNFPPSLSRSPSGNSPGNGNAFAKNPDSSNRITGNTNGTPGLNGLGNGANVQPASDNFRPSPIPTLNKTRSEEPTVHVPFVNHHGDTSANIDHFRTDPNVQILNPNGFNRNLGNTNGFPRNNPGMQSPTNLNPGNNFNTRNRATNGFNTGGQAQNNLNSGGQLPTGFNSGIQASGNANTPRQIPTNSNPAAEIPGSFSTGTQGTLNRDMQATGSFSGRRQTNGFNVGSSRGGGSMNTNQFIGRGQGQNIANIPRNSMGGTNSGFQNNVPNGRNDNARTIDGTNNFVNQISQSSVNNFPNNVDNRLPSQNAMPNVNSFSGTNGNGLDSRFQNNNMDVPPSRLGNNLQTQNNRNPTQSVNQMNNFNQQFSDNGMTNPNAINRNSQANFNSINQMNSGSFNSISTGPNIMQGSSLNNAQRNNRMTPRLGTTNDQRAQGMPSNSRNTPSGNTRSSNVNQPPLLNNQIVPQNRNNVGSNLNAPNSFGGTPPLGNVPQNNIQQRPTLTERQGASDVNRGGPNNQATSRNSQIPNIPTNRGNNAIQSGGSRATTRAGENANSQNVINGNTQTNGNGIRRPVVGVTSPETSGLPIGNVNGGTTNLNPTNTGVSPGRNGIPSQDGGFGGRFTAGVQNSVNQAPLVPAQSTNNLNNINVGVPNNQNRFVPSGGQQRNTMPAGNPNGFVQNSNQNSRIPFGMNNNGANNVPTTRNNFQNNNNFANFPVESRQQNNQAVMQRFSNMPNSIPTGRNGNFQTAPNPRTFSGSSQNNLNSFMNNNFKSFPSNFRSTPFGENFNQFNSRQAFLARAQGFPGTSQQFMQPSSMNMFPQNGRVMPLG